MLKKIAVTGDLIRPDGHLRQHSQSRNIGWLKSLIGHQLSEATSLNVHLANNDGVRFDFFSAYAAAGLSPGSKEWAALYDTAPEQVLNGWAEEFRDTLVIGFELPPSTRQALSQAGLTYIDAMIHPVRFMDDIFLAFRSNSPTINAALAKYAIPERHIYRAAGLITAFAYSKRWIDQEIPFTLFVAQMKVDRSMISGGILMSFADFQEQISSILGNPARLIYADHPLQKSDEAFEFVASHAGQAERSSRNTYGLLANPALDELVTISSSIGTEAKYFNRKVRFAMGPSTPVLFEGDVDDGASYWSIYNAFMVPDFWRDILRSVCTTTPSDGDQPPSRSNVLRSTLRTSWGYRDIIDDFAPVAPSSIAPSESPPALLKKLSGPAKLKRELVRPFYRLAGKRDIR